RACGGATLGVMEHPTPTPRQGLPIGRAALLATFAAGVGGIAVAPAINRLLTHAVPSTGGLGEVLPGIGGRWPLYSVQSPLPRFDPSTFELRISGLVDHPRQLRWSDVAALPGEHQTSDFHCVTGWSVDNVRWEGIRPKTIIDLVRPTAAARYVTLHSL